jgi:Ca2+-binding EF-hand superfamily protein
MSYIFSTNVIFSGDPTHYCHYAFKTIDKDQSGAINFAEYMSAVSLLLPGNIDKQLSLVCIYIYIN